MCTVAFRKPYIEQAVGGLQGAKDLIGRSEEQAAVQLVVGSHIYSEKR
jgi:hypothetical protein